MKISNIQKIVVDSPQVVTFTFNDNEPGDTTTDELYIQIDSDCDITAKGFVEKESGVQMKFNCISKLNTTMTASEPGIYMLMTGSLEKLELDVTPELTSEGYTPVNIITKSLI